MPKNDQAEYPWSAFAIPFGAGGIYFPGGELAPDQVTDGLSQTLLIVESAGQRIRWAEPRDADFDALEIGVNLPGQVRGTSDGVISSCHKGPTVVFADGSGRSLSEKIDPEVLRSLLLANDGPLKSDDF